MPGLSRLYFLLRRLSVMSPQELGFKASRMLRTRWRRQKGWSGDQPRSQLAWTKVSFLTSTTKVLFTAPTSGPPADPQRLLAGEVPFHGRWARWRPGQYFWHTDPHSGSVWPHHQGSAIDYRPGNPIGDVRPLWELNRLQHLFSLARIAESNAGQREKALEIFQSQFRSWRIENPPDTGVNWISALELALRLISVLHAFDLVREWVTPELRQEVLDFVVEHTERIEGNLSLYSSAGNHTVGEALGLLYAGTLLPELARAPRWRLIARQLLSRESARQVLPDGGGREQSTWYLLFVADALGLAQMLLAHAAQEPIPELASVLPQARTFLSALGRSPIDLPRLGDCDDGFALCPELVLSWISTPTGDHDFLDAGLSLITGTDGNRLIFLQNHLGLPPNFGHAHSHCLAVTLDYERLPVLIDPGTYRYSAPDGFRSYFRSSAGHNTVVAAGFDQARQLGAFMWGSPYRVRRLLKTVDQGITSILAVHDGFRHLRISHIRGICYLPKQFLVVWDQMPGQPQADLRAYWHLGAEAVIDESNSTVKISLGAKGQIIMESTATTTEMHRGAMNPPRGWKSERYGQLSECQTIEARMTGNTLLTVFWLPKSARDRSIFEPLIERFEKLARQNQPDFFKATKL